MPLDAPVRFEFESQKAYDQLPPGRLDVDPPPSLIATEAPPPPPASGQMDEAPTAEAAVNALRDIPRKLMKREAAMTTRKVHNGED